LKSTEPKSTKQNENSKGFCRIQFYRNARKNYQKNQQSLFSDSYNSHTMRVFVKDTVVHAVCN